MVGLIPSLRKQFCTGMNPHMKNGGFLVCTKICLLLVLCLFSYYYYYYYYMSVTRGGKESTWYLNKDILVAGLFCGLFKWHK